MPILVSRYRIAYFDTPKVASSSIKAALYRLEHGTDPVAVPGATASVEARIHKAYQQTRPLDPARDFAAAEGCWTATVVRDPVKRLLSAYANRIIHHRDPHRGRFPRTRAFLLGVPLDPDPDTFFLRLGRYKLQSGRIRHHVHRATRFIGTDLSRFDAVYPMERLDDFAAELSRRTGQEVGFPRLQTGGPKMSFDMLSPRARRALVDYLAPDYAVLADHYSPPDPG